MVKIQRTIDKYLGGLFVLLLYIFKFLDIKPNKPKKVLIIKLWAIGDSVIALSLINAINLKFKNAKIDVLTRKRIVSVFKAYDKINEIIDLDNSKDFFKILLSFRKYDIAFDCEPYMNLGALFSFWFGKYRIGFKNQFRSKLYSKTVLFNKKQHMVQNYLDMIRILKINFNTDKLEFLISANKDIKKVNSFLKKEKLTSGLIIGITAGVAESAKSRMWYEERFAKLCDKLIKELDAKVLFIDGPNNKDVIEKIINQMKEKPHNLVGKFNLSETFYLISKCKIFISNDTGPMHLAAAQGCKTIGLFGPNTPVLWGPYGKNNISIYKTKLPPSIQNDKGIFPEGNRKEFMGPISVNDVFDSVKKLL